MTDTSALITEVISLLDILDHAPHDTTTVDDYLEEISSALAAARKLKEVLDDPTESGN